MYNIRYRVLGPPTKRRPVNSDSYSVEFSWSLPAQYLNSRNDAAASTAAALFHGYQISVVPKSVPVLTDNYDDDATDTVGSSFGSVGAIVQRDQLSFVVRNLRSRTRYIFQIQSLGHDGQYGPASNLEFTIDPNFIDDQKQLGTSAENNDYDTSADILADTESESGVSAGCSKHYVSMLILIVSMLVYLIC